MFLSWRSVHIRFQCMSDTKQILHSGSVESAQHLRYSPNESNNGRSISSSRLKTAQMHNFIRISKCRGSHEITANANESKTANLILISFIPVLKRFQLMLYTHRKCNGPWQKANNEQPQPQKLNLWRCRTQRTHFARIKSV